MPYDIKARLRELVEEDHSRARDKDILYRIIVRELTPKQQEELFPLLLVEFINHHVRRPAAKPRSRGAVARQQPSQLQQQDPHRRALIMEAAGRRPLFIPSLVTSTCDGWVAYEDMTESNWREYVSSRQRISRISASLASWGGDNLRALHEYKAQTSGALPANVRESLLRRMPQTEGRELEEARNA